MVFRRIFISLVIFILIIGVVLSKWQKSNANPSFGTVSIHDKTFFVEVAKNREFREAGLSHRESISEDKGMFFVFNRPDKYGFWMKEMKFPIDIVWIDQNFKIIYIKDSVLPSSYPEVFYPSNPATYVLEISSGLSEKYDIKIGNYIKFSKK